MYTNMDSSCFMKQTIINKLSIKNDSKQTMFDVNKVSDISLNDMSKMNYLYMYSSCVSALI